MSKYQLGFAMCAEGLPCARPDDAEFSAGWCDALYIMTEDGELQESRDWHLQWVDDTFAVAYEPSIDDIIHEGEAFAHAGEFNEYGVII